METIKDSRAMIREKMHDEQEQYKAWLLQQSPPEILSHAQEYVIREGILSAMDNTAFTERQTEALLCSDSPVADIYQTWQGEENSIIEEITYAIECCADDLMRENDR